MRTRLGQNFLKNKDIASKIIEAAPITSDDIVVEIGPGEGILTECIIKKHPRKIIAIELDKKWAECVRRKFQANDSELTIINADALKIDYENLISTFCDNPPKQNPKTRAIFIGNLPYCSATAILKKILPGNFWKRAVFMFQKEVAERLAAAATFAQTRTDRKNIPKNIGYLTVFAAYYSYVETIISHVKPGAFDPSPKVFSSVLGFLPTEAQNRYSEDSLKEKLFFEIVGAAFSTRRKNILNAFHINLKRFLGKISCEKAPQLNDKQFLHSLLLESGVDPLRRAEQLHFDDFKNITETLFERYYGGKINKSQH